MKYPNARMLTVAALVVLASPGSTNAGTPSWASPGPSIRLDVADLDLSKPEVVARVYSKIEKSAALLCRDSASPWDSARAATLKRCVSAAVEDAVKQANASELTALHLSKKQRGELAGLTR